MAMQLNRGLAPHWFTPREQQGQARPARFQLKPLSGLYVLGLSGIFAGGQFAITEAQSREILQRGLVSWDGIDDETGSPLPCTPEHFDLLPPETVGELVGELLNGSSLAEEEKKTSGSPSPSPATPPPSTAPAASGTATATPATPHPSSSG